MRTRLGRRCSYEPFDTITSRNEYFRANAIVHYAAGTIFRSLRPHLACLMHSDRRNRSNRQPLYHPPPIKQTDAGSLLTSSRRLRRFRWARKRWRVNGISRTPILSISAYPINSSSVNRVSQTARFRYPLKCVLPFVL